MRDTHIAKKSLETFPDHLVPEGNWDAIKCYEDPDFGIGGVDEKGRLVVFHDDGTVHGFHLENATVEQTRFGVKLDTERDELSWRSLPQDYMFDRDVSEWVWVNPRYEYLTAGFER